MFSPHKWVHRWKKERDNQFPTRYHTIKEYEGSNTYKIFTYRRVYRLISIDHVDVVLQKSNKDVNWQGAVADPTFPPGTSGLRPVPSIGQPWVGSWVDNSTLVLSFNFCFVCVCGVITRRIPNIQWELNFFSYAPFLEQSKREENKKRFTNLVPLLFYGDPLSANTKGFLFFLSHFLLLSLCSLFGRRVSWVTFFLDWGLLRTKQNFFYGVGRRGTVAEESGSWKSRGHGGVGSSGSTKETPKVEEGGRRWGVPTGRVSQWPRQ